MKKAIMVQDARRRLVPVGPGNLPAVQRGNSRPFPGWRFADGGMVWMRQQTDLAAVGV